MSRCSTVQRSLEWCMGRPELPGVKRRIYYISKYDIIEWPTLPHNSNGRLTDATYIGEFTLRADASWKVIDIIPEKSQLTSEAQGEFPSQTQLNKLVAVHPSVDADATAVAAYLNNNDNVFLVEDMKGAFRVVGSEKWPTKTTVTQDLGQGAAGSTSTTISVEASDECPAPFYKGYIELDEEVLNSYSAEEAIKIDDILINTRSYRVTNGSIIKVDGNLQTIYIYGKNISSATLEANGTKYPFSISDDQKLAIWDQKVYGDAMIVVKGRNIFGSYVDLLRFRVLMGDNGIRQEEDDRNDGVVVDQP